jgi:hypothetical protein
VFARAATNRHYLVALASLMVVLTLSFQPLAAALLVVKDVWWQEPSAFLYMKFLKLMCSSQFKIAVAMKNLAAIGLNQNLQFNDLTCT